MNAIIAIILALVANVATAAEWAYQRVDATDASKNRTITYSVDDAGNKLIIFGRSGAGREFAAFQGMIIADVWGDGPKDTGMGKAYALGNTWKHQYEYANDKENHVVSITYTVAPGERATFDNVSYDTVRITGLATYTTSRGHNGSITRECLYAEAVRNCIVYKQRTRGSTGTVYNDTTATLLAYKP